MTTLPSTRSLPHDERTLELTVEGASPVVLLFAERSGRLLVLSSDPSSRWWASAVRRGRASIRVRGGGPLDCRVRLETSPAEVRGARDAFVSKYGRATVERYFDAGSRLISLDPRSGGEDVGYSDRVRTEFDAASGSYAERLEADPVRLYQKRRSLERLVPLVRGHDPLLEIGGGTGTETLPLLREGHRVTVVDISPGMLQALRARAQAAGAGSRLTTVEGRAGRLREALTGGAGGPFGGAYSTFGALNLEPDLGGLGDALADVLTPGAPLFVAVLNRHAPMPLLYGLLTGRGADALARLRSPLVPPATPFPVEVFPTTPGRFAARLGPRFELKRVEGASFLAPPVTYPRALARLGPAGIRSGVELDERLARGVAGWFSEWVFLTFRRRA